MQTTNSLVSIYIFFFFNDPAPTEIYTLSLHDALPISLCLTLDELAEIDSEASGRPGQRLMVGFNRRFAPQVDRKSTRLNSSHSQISYAVFCLKKKKHHRTDWSTLHRS